MLRNYKIAKLARLARSGHIHMSTASSVRQRDQHIAELSNSFDLLFDTNDLADVC